MKDWPKICRKLSTMRFAHHDERILFAHGLAASPNERLEMNENCLRLHGCWGWKNRRRFAQLRRKLDDATRPGLRKEKLSNAELAARHGFEP